MEETSPYTAPVKDIYTVYTKNRCSYCTKVKKLLQFEKPLLVECDDYLSTDKESFLKFIENLAGKEHRTFPMVFHNKVFIGGYTETQEYFEKMSAFTNNPDF